MRQGGLRWEECKGIHLTNMSKDSSWREQLGQRSWGRTFCERRLVWLDMESWVRARWETGLEVGARGRGW